MYFDLSQVYKPHRKIFLRHCKQLPNHFLNQPTEYPFN